MFTWTFFVSRYSASDSRPRSWPLALVDERAELRIPAVRHADPDLPRLVREARDELVVDRPLDENPRARRANLALREVDAEDRADDGPVEIGVGEDDRRRLAAELERDALDRPGARAHDRAARHPRGAEGGLVYLPGPGGGGPPAPTAAPGAR